MAAVTVNDLTSGTIDGTGVFDVLMQATNEHVQREYSKGRLKGSEYSQVYLGGLQAVMQNALQLLLEKQRTDLEAQLLQEQILTEQKRRLQIDGEIALLAAQTSKTTQETANAVAQGAILAEQLTTEQKKHAQMDAEVTLMSAQTAKTNSEKALVDVQVTNAGKQGLILDAQVTTEQKKHSQLDAETALTTARTSLTNADKLLTDQKVINAVTEETVLKAQKCKLDAEFDVLVEQKLKVTSEVTKIGSEISLLNQKVVTEQAQVSSLGVDTDSIIGRQKTLYENQAEGYIRDAEQKAAKMMIDAAMTQYTAHEVPLNGANLGAADVGAVVAKLKTGIGV
jgi:chromosome segregation ATPase